jgi:hypothetical protein
MFRVGDRSYNPEAVEILSGGCFSLCETISTVIFEPGSRLSCIERQTFSCCSSLSSTCIPSSVERLCEQGFYGCESLSTVTFESDSKLALVEDDSFPYFAPRLSIWIPPSLQDVLRAYPRWPKIILLEQDNDAGDQIEALQGDT